MRYCGICDAFEVIGRKVAVIGDGDGGAGEALFMRTYTDDITLFSLGVTLQLGAEHQLSVAEAGIVPVESQVRDVATDGEQVVVTTEDGRVYRFDYLYSALGDTIRSDLARDLGAKLADKACVITDPHQHTSVDGLFAAGDVIVGLDQISAAMGHAAVAATAIHNRLRGCA